MLHGALAAPLVAEPTPTPTPPPTAAAAGPAWHRPVPRHAHAHGHAPYAAPPPPPPSASSTGPSFSRRGRPPSDLSVVRSAVQETSAPALQPQPPPPPPPPAAAATAAAATAAAAAATAAATAATAPIEARPVPPSSTQVTGGPQIVHGTRTIFWANEQTYCFLLESIAAGAARDGGDATGSGDHVPVPVLRQALPAAGPSAAAHPHPHGREAVPVQRVRPALQPVAAGAHPHARPFRFVVIVDGLHRRRRRRRCRRSSAERHAPSRFGTLMEHAAKSQ